MGHSFTQTTVMRTDSVKLSLIVIQQGEIMVHISDYPLIKASEVAPQIKVIILNFLKV